MQTLVIYEVGVNQNYYTFTLVLPIKIILCSKFPRSKFIGYKCFDMNSVQPLCVHVTCNPLRASWSFLRVFFDAIGVTHHTAPKLTDAYRKPSMSSSEKSVNPGEAGTQRAIKGLSPHFGPTFSYLIRRNPPMSLRAAYRRVVGLIAMGYSRSPFGLRCVGPLSNSKPPTAPHGGQRTFHQSQLALRQLTLRLYLVIIWSRCNQILPCWYSFCPVQPFPGILAIIPVW